MRKIFNISYYDIVKWQPQKSEQRSLVVMNLYRHHTTIIKTQLSSNQFEVTLSYDCSVNLEFYTPDLFPPTIL